MAGLMRIGELSRESGVSPDVLRAWERRYNLFAPIRTAGGFRLYTEGDLERVRAMRLFVESGIPASEAARRVQEPRAPEPARPAGLETLRAALRSVLRSFDDAGAQAVIDHLFAAYDLERVIVDVILPELKALGDDWEAGTASVGQEHFAVNLLRGRLLGIARGWDRGVGPKAVLACPEGERHDISLIMFGIIANQRGWRVTFLGADTPLESVAAAARELDADAVVLYITSPDQVAGHDALLRELAARARLYAAGPGASTAPGPLIRLQAGMVEGAERIGQDWQTSAASRSGA